MKNLKTWLTGAAKALSRMVGDAAVDRGFDTMVDTVTDDNTGSEAKESSLGGFLKARGAKSLFDELIFRMAKAMAMMKEKMKDLGYQEKDAVTPLEMKYFEEVIAEFGRGVLERITTFFGNMAEEVIVKKVIPAYELKGRGRNRKRVKINETTINHKELTNRMGAIAIVSMNMTARQGEGADVVALRDSDGFKDAIRLCLRADGAENTVRNKLKESAHRFCDGAGQFLNVIPDDPTTITNALNPLNNKLELALHAIRNN